MCFWKDNKRQTRLTSERIKELTAINELSTTEYTVAKVVKAEDAPSLLRGQLGDRKVLYSCRIYLKAGINMDKYDPSKTVIDPVEKSVTLSLPHATLLSFNMPAEEITTVFEDISFFRSRFSADEQNYILQLGEADIRAYVPNLGILEDAEKNAKEVFICKV